MIRWKSQVSYSPVSEGREHRVIHNTECFGHDLHTWKLIHKVAPSRHLRLLEIPTPPLLPLPFPLTSLYSLLALMGLLLYTLTGSSCTT